MHWLIILLISCSLTHLNSYFGRLHMLNEIEETMRVFLHFSGDGSTSDDSREGSRVTPQQLLSHWQTRLNMMQVRTPYFTHRSAVIERETARLEMWGLVV